LFDEVTRAWTFCVATNMGFHHVVGSWAFDNYGKTTKTIRNRVEGFTDIYSERL